MTTDRLVLDGEVADLIVEILTRRQMETLRGRIEAMKTWPKGANGPIAVAAYESFVASVERLLNLMDGRVLYLADSAEVARDD